MCNHLLFVESNTTGTGMLALRQAAELGARPVLLTNDPGRYRGLEEAPCRVIACNTNAFSHLIEVINAEVGAAELGGITTTSEFYITTVAALTAHYGLPGNPVEAMQACRNKAETRLRLAEAGVGQPHFAIAHSAEEVPSLLPRVGLPCVVKPADDTGSYLVRLCRTEAEAVEQAGRVLAVTTNVRGQAAARLALVEEFVSAPEFSVEMFTWQGRTTCLGITEKHLTGERYFVEYKHFFPAVLDADQAANIEGTVRRALAAVGVESGATHTEVKWTPQGSKIVEINGRLAGGMIPELVRLATGIDPLEQQLKAALGREPVLTPVRRCCAAIHFLTAGRSGVLREIRGVEQARGIPGVEQVTITGRPGMAVKLPESAYDRLGFVIASAPDYALTARRLQAAVDQIEMVIEPPAKDQRP